MTDLKTLNLSVVERPEVKLVGIKVSSNLAKAGEDCPKLWQTFMQKWAEAGGPAAEPCWRESFGISIMTDESGSFDYWATLPADSFAGSIAGLSEITILGGLYVKRQAASLAELGEAFESIYRGWNAAEDGYEINFMAPCLERYDENYMKNGSLEIYAPVRKLKS